MNWNHLEIRMNFLNVREQHEYSCFLIPLYIKDMNLIVFVYDVSSYYSLQVIRSYFSGKTMSRWNIEGIQIQMMLLGNKID